MTREENKVVNALGKATGFAIAITLLGVVAGLGAKLVQLTWGLL